MWFILISLINIHIILEILTSYSYWLIIFRFDFLWFTEKELSWEKIINCDNKTQINIRSKECLTLHNPFRFIIFMPISFVESTTWNWNWSPVETIGICSSIIILFVNMFNPLQHLNSSFYFNNFSFSNSKFLINNKIIIDSSS